MALTASGRTVVAGGLLALLTACGGATSDVAAEHSSPSAATPSPTGIASRVGETFYPNYLNTPGAYGGNSLLRGENVDQYDGRPQLCRDLVRALDEAVYGLPVLGSPTGEVGGRTGTRLTRDQVAYSRIYQVKGATAVVERLQAVGAACKDAGTSSSTGVNELADEGIPMSFTYAEAVLNESDDTFVVLLSRFVPAGDTLLTVGLYSFFDAQDEPPDDDPSRSASTLDPITYQAVQTASRP